MSDHLVLFSFFFLYMVPSEQPLGAFLWRKVLNAKRACFTTSPFIIQKHYEIIYFANKIII